MKDFGVRLQYSVFLCDLSDLERARWHTKMHNTIDLAVDSVIQIDLGGVDSCADVVALGVPRTLPPRGPIVL